jgi:hypothetical protein
MFWIFFLIFFFPQDFFFRNIWTLKKKLPDRKTNIFLSLLVLTLKSTLERLWSVPSLKDIAMRTDLLDSNYLHKDGVLRVSKINLPVHHMTNMQTLEISFF